MRLWGRFLAFVPTLFQRILYSTIRFLFWWLKDSNWNCREICFFPEYPWILFFHSSRTSRIRQGLRVYFNIFSLHSKRKQTHPLICGWLKLDAQVVTRADTSNVLESTKSGRPRPQRDFFVLLLDEKDGSSFWVSFLEIEIWFQNADNIWMDIHLCLRITDQQKLTVDLCAWARRLSSEQGGAGQVGFINKIIVKITRPTTYHQITTVTSTLRFGCFCGWWNCHKGRLASNESRGAHCTSKLLLLRSRLFHHLFFYQKLLLLHLEISDPVQDVWLYEVNPLIPKQNKQCHGGLHVLARFHPMAALAALRSPAMLCLCESDAFAARKAVVSWWHWIFGEVVVSWCRENRGNAHWDKEQVFFLWWWCWFFSCESSVYLWLAVSDCSSWRKSRKIPCGRCASYTCHARSPHSKLLFLNLGRFRPLQTLSDLHLTFRSLIRRGGFGLAHACRRDGLASSHQLGGGVGSIRDSPENWHVPYWNSPCLGDILVCGGVDFLWSSFLKSNTVIPFPSTGLDRERTYLEILCRRVHFFSCWEGRVPCQA